MIVCSCTLITAKDVEETVSALRTRDPFVVLTPGLIYRHLGKRPSCGDCLPLITKLMVAYDEDGPAGRPTLPPGGSALVLERCRPDNRSGNECAADRAG